MRKRSRLLSLILAVILVVSMLVPVSAFADSGEYSVVLHANRQGRGFHKWNSATQVYDYSVERRILSGTNDGIFSGASA